LVFARFFLFFGFAPRLWIRTNARINARNAE